MGRGGGAGILVIPVDSQEPTLIHTTYTDICASNHIKYFKFLIIKKDQALVLTGLLNSPFKFMHI